MSAIWGIVSRGLPLEEEKILGMKKTMEEYRLDKTAELKQDTLYFACGHQFITPESVSDVSPVHDTERKITFTGDVFLYNREAVYERLSGCSGFSALFGKDTLSDCGDALLAYRAFLLLGDSFVKFLRGSFAIAIWEEETKKLHLFADHFSKRYLAFSAQKDYVCFGSTLKPIRACLGKRLALNRRFLIQSYRDMSPMNFTEPGATAFEGVFHVDNACHVTIHVPSGTITKEQYWNPLLSVSPLKLSGDAAYQALFLKTYRSVTLAHLRSLGETGIMLSGGLDSASVAALAAPALAASGKKLFSYTSVPAPGFQVRTDSCLMENEGALIEEQQKAYPNLCPRYVSSDKENCMSRLEAFQRTYDLPVKPSVNNANIDRMGAAAQSDNCRILLSGANGNATVSYGSIGQYLTLSLQKGHPLRAFREMSAFCTLHQLSRKKYFFRWLRVLFRYLFTNPEENSYYLKQEDIQNYHLEHLKRQQKKTFGTEYFTTEKQKNAFLYIPMQYIQKGFYYTYQGLLHGYLQADPTLTVEMVELVLSFPPECFVHQGVERRMIRDYMKELIPAPILSEKKGQGIQAADFAYCVNRDWDTLKASVYDILEEPLLREYLEEEKLKELIQTIQKEEYHLDKSTVWDAALIGSLGYFLRDFSSGTQNLSTTA